VTGADFSPEAIAIARSLAGELGIPATFVCANLYDLPEAMHVGAVFDIVYTSGGVLGWLPDLEAWAHVVDHFVKPGGTFYIAEGHPVTMAFEKGGRAARRTQVPVSVLDTSEPISLEVHGSYADRDAPTDGLIEHRWNHSLGEIVTALAQSRLRIEFCTSCRFRIGTWVSPCRNQAVASVCRVTWTVGSRSRSASRPRNRPHPEQELMTPAGAHASLAIVKGCVNTGPSPS
jgi:SAM-dependent methyltransferase